MTVRHHEVGDRLPQRAVGVVSVGVDHGSPPADIAGVPRGDLGQQQPAGGGLDAVRAHQQVTCRGVPAGELRHDAVRAAVETHQFPAQVIAGRGEGV
jgi:hypothetical protein